MSTQSDELLDDTRTLIVQLKTQCQSLKENLRDLQDRSTQNQSDVQVGPYGQRPRVGVTTQTPPSPSTGSDQDDGSAGGEEGRPADGGDGDRKGGGASVLCWPADVGSVRCSPQIFSPRRQRADKCALDSKVSQRQFDSVTERLSSMFHELLDKVVGQEHDWQQVVGRLSTELECKVRTRPQTDVFNPTLAFAAVDYRNDPDDGQIGS